MNTETITNLFDLNQPALQSYFLAHGEKAYRAQQLLQWIHQCGVDDFDEMSNFSKGLRARLKATSRLDVPEVVLDRIATDGTRKWLLRLNDGNCIETVFIPEKSRGTLCVSSQVGCALNCRFCATGQQGYNRNLAVAEIIGQVWIATRRLSGADKRHDHTISNVVMMGMGEPLLNFTNVVAAMDIMMDDFAYGLSKRRVTLSTSGIVPAIRQLAGASGVSLAVSLHAPNDELRNQLVPINKKYPLHELLAACRYYSSYHLRRRITIEYVMLDGINDQPEHAHQLVRLLQGMAVKINLIPFNPFPHTQYRCSPMVVIDRFQAMLMAAGYTTITRKTRGNTIDAACGQLVGRVQDRRYRSQCEVVTG